jgi:hypothetical protein
LTAKNTSLYLNETIAILLKPARGMGLEKSSLMAEGFLYFRLIQGKPSA